MKIAIERSVPFMEGVFEPFAETVYLQIHDMTPEAVRDCDVIITSNVKCNAALLDSSSVSMIASAGIDLNHIDMEYCRNRGIHVTSSYGSDANGVMNYVFSALYGVAARKSISLTGKTFGIIGVGQCGSKVAHMARHLGFPMLLCDVAPSLQFSSELYCDLDTLLSQADIVSLHVPLNDKTADMVGEDFFSKIRDNAIFINASRGEVVDEDALIRAIPRLGAVVVDTWRHEPRVNKELLELVDIATPHIAGFSYQSKQNASAIAVRSVARFFAIQDLYEFYPQTTVQELNAVKLDMRGKLQGQIASEFQYNYPIFTDDFMFRMDPDSFETLQEEYNYRREFFID